MSALTHLAHPATAQQQAAWREISSGDVCYSFLTISLRPIISKSTGPIFAKFSGLVLLLLLLLLFNAPCIGHKDDESQA